MLKQNKGVHVMPRTERIFPSEASTDYEGSLDSRLVLVWSSEG